MLQRKILSLSNLSFFENEPSFHENTISERKNELLWIMPGDFQVICVSMVSKNHQSPASTETLDYIIW